MYYLNILDLFYLFENISINIFFFFGYFDDELIYGFLLYI